MTSMIFARRRGELLLIVSAVVAGIAVLAAVCSFGPIDLEVYRFGSQALVAGHDLYGPLPATRAGVSLPFIYPPFGALVLLPLAIPPLAVASVLLTVLTMASLWAALRVVIRRLWTVAPRRASLAALVLTAPSLALEPVRSTLSFGQINMLVMALVVVDCLAEKPPWPRGMLVGIAAAIKVTPAAFLLFFLLRKDFRAAMTVVATGAAASAFAFVMAPGASLKYWFSGQLTGAGGLAASPLHTNQTIAAALRRLHLPPDGLLWWVLAGLVIIAAVLVIRRAEPPMAVMVTAAAALVISPISWSHHWVWIAPALLVFAKSAPRWLTVTVAVVFVAGPFMMLPGGGDRELAWSAWQHVIGNVYLILVLAFLAWQLFGSRQLAAGRHEQQEHEQDPHDHQAATATTAGLRV
ncbi:alpha-1,2-mannosyltransferase [Amycolatopsis xylanica]|uniref:Alpha-1,2-mannosyltransferase n=1 Tax=Amycolatopsis xylanica TaxID=589385 RepID=A0A1H3PDS5_9PSEU|nr:glycosyltransferase 87 family protein [Amycolatopsis xylanica]SDY99231.1 alpha-1,2-mannosyltransferase [Amycolatopsis xylanica]